MLIRKSLLPCYRLESPDIKTQKKFVESIAYISRRLWTNLIHLSCAFSHVRYLDEL
jgi:hypothetical protein